VKRRTQEDKGGGGFDGLEEARCWALLTPSARVRLVSQQGASSELLIVLDAQATFSFVVPWNPKHQNPSSLKRNASSLLLPTKEAFVTDDEAVNLREEQ